MKYITLFTVAIICSIQSFGANYNDSLSHCYKQIEVTQSTVQTLQYENESLKGDLATLNQNIELQITEIDSLKSELSSVTKSIEALADSLNVNITNTQ